EHTAIASTPPQATFLCMMLCALPRVVELGGIYAHFAPDAIHGFVQCTSSCEDPATEILGERIYLANESSFSHLAPDMDCFISPLPTEADCRFIHRRFCNEV
ncbi:hypothetical protein BKA62DRAFT_694634, partial [Auriculariales sp. MPI-PUGE-AT-0066]